MACYSAETGPASEMDILLQTSLTCDFHTRVDETKFGGYPRGI